MFPDSLPSIIPYPGWLTSFTKGLGFFYCILNSYILMRKLLSKPSQTVRCITKCIPQGLGRKVFPHKCTPKVAKLCSHEISGDITDDETATWAHEDDTKWIACCFISLFQHPNDVKFTKKNKNNKKKTKLRWLVLPSGSIPDHLFHQGEPKHLSNLFSSKTK